jgi:hypothetical protein
MVHAELILHKNRDSTVVVLRRGGAGRQWKRCGVWVAGAEEWSTVRTIVLRLGQGSF